MKLFARKAGKTTLTHAGQLYAQEVSNAFGLIANATSLVAPQSQSGQLVIACTPSLAAKWLQPRMPDFLRDYPGVKVRLFALSSHETFDKDSCDVAIVYRKSTDVRTYGEPLIQERLQPLCSPGLSAALDLRAPDDLSRATLTRLRGFARFEGACSLFINALDEKVFTTSGGASDSGGGDFGRWLGWQL
ncbi:MAG TPA: LysR substrate-binding domain-containing protein, partial [Acetobacteraceae bacterium]|nr:LysR substrate-binding domain-containing protein [Acetobacteraceae bacterium]